MTIQLYVDEPHLAPVSWPTRLKTLRAHPTPLSADLPPVELSSPQVRTPALGEPVYGVATRDVPLLALPETRLDFDYGDPLGCAARQPLDALGLLASTQTGFMPSRSPDYRFPAPLAGMAALCDAASTLYSHEDARSFRRWMEGENESLAARAGTLVNLIQAAISLPLPQQEMLMVPLIYLNHMWRQGSPALEAAERAERDAHLPERASHGTLGVHRDSASLQSADHDHAGMENRQPVRRCRGVVS